MSWLNASMELDYALGRLEVPLIARECLRRFHTFNDIAEAELYISPRVKLPTRDAPARTGHEGKRSLCHPGHRHILGTDM